MSRSDPSAEARRQFMAGERLFRAGRYREAVRAYQRGYRLSQRPGFLINIAHCQVRMGHPELAREQYRRFLAAAPDAPHAAEVARAMAEIDARLAPRPTPPGSSTGDAPPLAARETTPAVTPPLAELPPLPLTARDRLHQPSPGEDPLKLRETGAAAAPASPRWLWPVIGVAALSVVAATVAVFAGRDQRSGGLSRGSIGTIRQ